MSDASRSRRFERLHVNKARLRKPLHPQQIVRAIRWLKEVGHPVHGSVCIFAELAPTFTPLVSS